VTVPCLDLPAALRFYSDGLGLRLAGQARGHAILDAGGVRLVLLDAVQVPGFHKESGQGLFLELAVADLGAVAARLEASGLRLSTPRPSRAGRVLSVEDPEGNVVSLIETGALRSF
jgi:catechol 2,3-dioxygenase-like lactoylglutathione lyase family enzyme